jgi:hypothetical protein
MFSIVSIEVKLGPEFKALSPRVSAIGHIAPGGTAVPPGRPGKLTVSWQDVQPDPDVFALLTWHTRISKFAGRDAEMTELRRWAVSEPAVALKFVTGDGGVGKSRLAAEFAAELQAEGWAAGFVDLRKPQSFRMHHAGTLLVIDYPEERRKEVADLLQDLSYLARGVRLRVLFLTRRQVDDWLELVHDSNASPLLDVTPVTLGEIDGKAAHTVFSSAQEGSAESFATEPIPVSIPDLAEWAKMTPENHRPLFVVAAAVHNAIHPEDFLLRFTGPEAMDSLVEWEMMRLRNRARSAGLKDDDALARVLAMSAIAGAVPVGSIAAMGPDDLAAFGFRSGDDVEKVLRDAMLVRKDVVSAPSPDILAAAFAVRVLARAPQAAAEIVWSGLAREFRGGLERLARLSYDSEVVLGNHENRMSRWLAEAVDGRVDRCRDLEPFVTEPTLPVGLVPAAVSVGQSLLAVANEQPERARLLNNLSTNLSDAGRGPEALAAIQEAVEIYRRLAAANPARYEPDLARALGTMGLAFRLGNRHGDAARAFGEGADVARPHAMAQPHSPLTALLARLESNYRKSRRDAGQPDVP